ncbi:MAG: chemotaxis protein CheW [Rhizobiales bacterium]|nr:chemotaxis protein CheW [Hyphomicrobiales bacterium]
MSAQAFSQADGAAAAGHDVAQFITFAIGDDHYGIDIMAVREIKDWTAIRHLPHQPDYVRGICSLRGAFIPIIDMRCRFGQGLTQATPLHVFIIVQIGAQQVGLLADRVSDIVTVERATIKPVPEVDATKGRGFLSGLATIDEATVGLIALDSILAADAGAGEPDTPAAEMASA